MENLKLILQQIASIIKDAISAIYYMHNTITPIMNRDIKPENILINSSMQAKLTDFGWSNIFKLIKKEIPYSELRFIWRRR